VHCQLLSPNAVMQNVKSPARIADDAGQYAQLGLAYRYHLTRKPGRRRLSIWRARARLRFH
jgi:hypothetical protein